jgi:hypothetical protein
VAYDPGNPADAHDLSMSSSWEGQFYLGVGALVLGIALAVFLNWLVFVRLKSACGAGGARTGPSEGRHVRSGQARSHCRKPLPIRDWPTQSDG